MMMILKQAPEKEQTRDERKLLIEELINKFKLLNSYDREKIIYLAEKVKNRLD